MEPSHGESKLRWNQFEFAVELIVSQAYQSLVIPGSGLIQSQCGYPIHLLQRSELRDQFDGLMARPGNPLNHRPEL